MREREKRVKEKEKEREKDSRNRILASKSTLFTFKIRLFVFVLLPFFYNSLLLLFLPLMLITGKVRYLPLNCMIRKLKCVHSVRTGKRTGKRRLVKCKEKGHKERQFLSRNHLLLFFADGLQMNSEHIMMGRKKRPTSRRQEK